MAAGDRRFCANLLAEELPTKSVLGRTGSLIVAQIEAAGKPFERFSQQDVLPEQPATVVELVRNYFARARAEATCSGLR